jgi:CheY-like chemotaxis protein
MTKGSPTSRSILIVEDEQFLAEAYHTILTAKGYSTDIAHDGAKALEILSQNAPQLILLDLRMPNLDGLGFLRALQKLALDTKVIVLSNHSNRHEIDDAYKLGAHRYLVKAWTSPSELARVVAEALV